MIENVVLNKNDKNLKIWLEEFIHWLSVNWFSSRLNIINCRIKLANGILLSVWKPLDDQIKLISDRVKSVPILFKRRKEMIEKKKEFFIFCDFTVEEFYKIVLYWFYLFVVDQYEKIL